MRRLAALFVLALAIAGCGTTTTAGSTGGSSSSAPAAGGDTAPFGTVDAVGGGQIDGAKLAGRDLALWFWAPW
jgi:hypothetical protein